MAARRKHKLAIWHGERVALCCKVSGSVVGKYPILVKQWADVRCRFCERARFNGVPERLPAPNPNGKPQLTVIPGGA